MLAPFGTLIVAVPLLDVQRALRCHQFMAKAMARARMPGMPGMPMFGDIAPLQLQHVQLWLKI